MAKTGGQRLPALGRVSHAPPFRFQADGRDGRIVHWVHDCRLLTSEQIQRLEFPGPSISHAKRRLMLLYQHGYLDRIAYSQGPYGAPRFVYGLGPEGATFLEHRFKVGTGE